MLPLSLNRQYDCNGIKNNVHSIPVQHTTNPPIPRFRKNLVLNCGKRKKKLNFRKLFSSPLFSGGFGNFYTSDGYGGNYSHSQVDWWGN